MPDLDALLAPRSIAIIGASPDTGIIRGKLQQVMQARGYPGQLYPVSRSHADVQGRKAYASIADIPDRVDLAIIVVPANVVPAALEECGRNGVKAAYIISSGFAEEAGSAGAALQDTVRDLARRYDMAVCGPNAEGFVNAPADIVATFSSTVCDYATPMLPKVTNGRRIGVIAQSGGIGFAFFHRGRPRELRFDFTISTGNEAALDSFAFVEHLVESDKADIVLMYLEAVKDTPRFLAAAAKAADRGKPLIVAKMGRSEVGQRAAASHTASLAGADSAYDALFRRYGIIRADDMDAMLDMAAAFSFCPLPSGPRVAVMSGSGGAGVWMADTLAVHGLELPPLDAATRAEIEALIPSFGSAGNPVDLTAAAIHKVGYAPIVEILQRSPAIDAVVVAGSLPNTHRLQSEREIFKRAAAHPEKPLLFCAYTAAPQEAVALGAEMGMPIFGNMSNCARALRAMVEYGRFQERWYRRDTDPAVPPEPALRDRLRGMGRVLCEYEAKDLLAGHGVANASEVLASDAEAAARAAAELGFPVALKIQSPDLPHKTEIGGVALDLRTPESVRAAFGEIIGRARAAAPRADLRGVLVQRMAPRGQEIILGVNRDPTFGPMLMVGLGGIHVEVLGDVAFAPAPVTEAEARSLLAGLRGARLLEGVRGAPPADTDALVGLMVQVSRFASGLADEIEEIDLNPVLVHPAGQGLTVVDALILQREPAEPRPSEQAPATPMAPAS